MFESATHIDEADILMEYKLPCNYFLLKSMRGFRVNENTGIMQILSQNVVFHLDKNSNLAYRKDENGRIYLNYLDAKTKKQMLIKLPEITEKDKSDEGFVEFIECLERYHHANEI
jgi:hypothetical protein